jgi:hypothetical protein
MDLSYPALLGASEMAKAKSGVNKSEAIRGALNELPNAMAKEIVAHLKAKGIETSEQLVYQVRKVSKKKKPGRKPGTVPQAKAMVSAPSANGVLSVGASITQVKGLAGRVGGLASLKEIVDALQ